ncbi:hypothetical protein TRICHSKD4_1678 [Roseibium sp. TrichSKD4]|nr:hypothetical protein TRICHSKD4_1678 [Roseibium sp. TrichSKD4]
MPTSCGEIECVLGGRSRLLGQLLRCHKYVSFTAAGALIAVPAPKTCNEFEFV